MARSLAREQKKLARQVDRARLTAIRVRLRDLRKARPARMREIRQACRVARENVRHRAKALREQTRAALRESILAMRTAQRGTCERSKATTRADFERRIDEASRELGLGRAHYRAEYGRARGPRMRTTSTERRQESDDEVRRNLPAELVPVFNRIRSTIKATPRRSRTEAFLQWVHDNSDEAHRIVYDAVERDVERLVREQEAIESRQRSRYAGDTALDALADNDRAMLETRRSMRWRAISRSNDEGKMSESEAHKQWRAQQHARWMWNNDFHAALLRLVGVVADREQREALASDHADHMAELRRREDTDVIAEPPYLDPNSELPGAVGGNPGDAFARRPAFNPHT